MPATAPRERPWVECPDSARTKLAAPRPAAALPEPAAAVVANAVARMAALWKDMVGLLVMVWWVFLEDM